MIDVLYLIRIFALAPASRLESDGLRPPQHGRSMKGGLMRASPLQWTNFVPLASGLNLNDKTIALGYHLKLLICKRWSTPSAQEWFRELY